MKIKVIIKVIVVRNNNTNIYIYILLTFNLLIKLHAFPIIAGAV